MQIDGQTAHHVTHLHASLGAAQASVRLAPVQGMIGFLRLVDYNSPIGGRFASSTLECYLIMYGV